MLSIEEKRVYAALYDVVNRNMATAGKTFVPTKNSFLLSTELEPQKTNLELLKDVNKEEIVQTAYVTVLRRFPDEGAIQYWKQPYIYQREDYNKIVIKSVVNSIERTMKGIDLYNAEAVNIDISRFGRLKEKLFPILNLLYKIYRLLPASIRKIIKKVLRRG